MKEILVMNEYKNPNIVTYLERSVFWQKMDLSIHINLLLHEAWEEIAFCPHKFFLAEIA